MTPREKEIIKLIRQDPAISQQSIADKLNIARSSVANHIKNLSSQGYILGRQYVLRDEPYILVVGGANVDILGYSNSKLVKKDSNIGKISQSTGGVARNIAENLARLDLRTSFISIVGNDNRGKLIMDELNDLKIDIENIFVLDGQSTSVYMAILDENRDMELAINDMTIVDKLSPDLIAKKVKIFENATYVLVDTNLSQESLDYIFTRIKQRYFVDCVSAKKVEKIKIHLDKIFFLKANKNEAEVLSELKIKDLEDAKRAAKKIIELGTESLVITMGSEGSLYADKDKLEYLKARSIDVVNASGAGDAFMAAYIYAFEKGKSIRDRLKFADAASRLALKSEETNSKLFRLENIEGEI